MLEAGLSLIAACLPTLSYLFTHFSVQSALQSVRSTLSLRLLGFTWWSANTITTSGKDEGPYTEVEANSSAASHAKILNWVGL